MKFENDATVYGFHPSSAAEKAAGSEKALLDLLLNHVAQEGSWQDDTDIFRQAYELSQTGERTKVWSLDRKLNEEDYQKILDAAKQWYTCTRSSFGSRRGPRLRPRRKPTT